MKHARVVAGVVVEIPRRPFTSVDGRQHPANIFEVWARAEKLSIGIYEINEEVLGSGPILESRNVQVFPDHIVYTDTYRQKTATEISLEKDADAALSTLDREGKVALGLLRVCLALWRQANPGVSVTQFETFLNSAISDNTITPDRFITFVRSRL